MPLIKSGSRSAFKQNVSELISSGKPKDQALAIAYRNSRDHGGKFAKGGLLPAFKTSRPGLAAPANHALKISPSRSGLIASAVPGRTDRIAGQVKPNSYVVPADVVSGLGQGNTMAGARILDHIASSVGPYGSKMPAMRRGRGVRIPRQPRLRRYDDGGMVEGQMVEGQEERTPVITAGGEYLFDPEVVTAMGGGDPKKGHAILDNMVKKIRKQVIDQMKQLPGPVR